MRIVVVDDDPLFLRLIQKAFETAAPGAAVLSAPGLQRGCEALQRLSRLALLPDLILIDSSLGDGTGLQLLEYLRGDERLSRVPAVLVTAMLDDASSKAARAAGAVGCYQKPAGFEPLVELAATVIQHAAPARTL